MFALNRIHLDRKLSTLIALLHPAIFAVNRSAGSGLKRELSNLGAASRTLPVALHHAARSEVIPTAAAASHIASFLRPAFFAVNRFAGRGFKRQFGDFRAAFGAGPVALNHRSGRPIVIVVSHNRFQMKLINKTTFLTLSRFTY